MAQSLATLHCAGVNASWNEFHRALAKGIKFNEAEKGLDKTRILSSMPKSSLSTSTVQQIIESFNGTAGKVVIHSDVMQAAAALGHIMNGCGVVTSSIHADISYTLGEYLYNKLKLSTKELHMNVASLEVFRGLVVNNHADSTQLIQVSVNTEDIRSNMAELKWYNMLSCSLAQCLFMANPLKGLPLGYPSPISSNVASTSGII